MNKEETLAFLKQEGIPYELSEHEAVFNMEEVSHIELPYPEADAKNLFVRDDKKRSYYLITVKGDKRVDLKEFRRANGTRPLSFASEADLLRIMKLIPGAVTPLGLLNDEERIVTLFLDAEFLEEPARIGVHPNDNTATVWLNTQDLTALIRAHGNDIRIVSL